MHLPGFAEEFVITRKHSPLNLNKEEIVLGVPKSELSHLLSICALDPGVGANVIIHTFTCR